MRIYLTGGTGYIGSNISRKLIKDGNDVAILKRNSSDLQYLSGVQEKIQFYNYSNDFKSVDKSINDFSPNLAIHLASHYTFSHSPEDIDNLINSNIKLGLYLAESLVKNKVKYLINTGTSFEHFNNEEYSPVNLYAATKHALEDLLRYYADSKLISCITLKLFDTYGPNDKRKKLLWLLQEKAKQNGTIKLSGGDQNVDFVYIEDVVSAYLSAIRLLLDKPLGFWENYGISGRERMSLKNFVKKTNRILGNKIKVKFGELPYRNREVMEPWKEFKKMDEWEPRYSIDEGLQQTLISDKSDVD